MSITFVSGYWNLGKKSKYGENTYTNTWFKNTLKTNHPYIFFVTKDTIDVIKKYREGLPTTYVFLEIEDFTTYYLKDNISIDRLVCPCPELGLIWHEKIFLVQRAWEMNPYNTDYFQWIDAGIVAHRKRPPVNPVVSPKRVSQLPKNKFIFSGYYSYGTNRYISGTSFTIHKDFIILYSELYIKYLEKYRDRGIPTDEELNTFIFKDYPEIYHRDGFGFGRNVNWLFESSIFSL